ncbi:MAG: RNA-binding S4 domain-containing protein [Clostridiales bacterium]|jgi:ribosome-associated protein|nr:RNA-binding S4 domain-containing protein [Clostridiales bacterium]
MKIQISTEYIKLDDLLKFSGIVYSGGEAKHDIQLGLVRVNGNICTQRGKKLRVGDIILCRGEEIEIT